MSKLVPVALVSITMTLILVSACTKKRDVLPGSVDCTTINAKFSTDISIIIQSTCAINSSCHGTGSVFGPGPLTSYAQISGAATNIKAAVVSRRMPLGSTLSEKNINKIKCWIDSGAPNN